MTAALGQPANHPHAPDILRNGDLRACNAGRELEARLGRLMADPTVRLLMEREGLERDVLIRTARAVLRKVEESRDGPVPGAR